MGFATARLVAAVRTVPNPVPAVPEVAAAVPATLNGLSGTKDRPLAIINNYTFAKGEEADVHIGSGRMHIRCVEIKEESVVIDVNGERQELRLRSGI